MRKVFIVLAFVVFFALSRPAEAQVGSGRAFSTTAHRCGASFVFGNELCGNRLNSAALSSPTNVSACDTTPGTADKITTGGNYQLTGNVSAATAGTECFRWTSGASLDCKGFTISGRITLNGFGGGALVQNCFINCDWADNGSDAGCVRWIQNPTASGPLVLQNVTIRNSNAAGRHVYMAQSSGTRSYSGGGAQVRWYNLDLLSPSAPSAVRWTNAYAEGFIGLVQGQDSKIVVAADTQAAQGFVCFGCTSFEFANNWGVMNDTTTAESGRLFVGDAQNASCAPASNSSGIVHDNMASVYDHRFARQRCQPNVRVYNNLIERVIAGSTVFHGGDADNGEDLANANFRIENNDISINGGDVLMIRNASGVSMDNNRVRCIGTCSGARFAFVRTPIGPGTLSTVTIRNNPGIAGSGMTNENTAESGATLNRCNSGSANGGGTNNTTSC